MNEYRIRTKLLEEQVVNSEELSCVRIYRKEKKECNEYDLL
jgi:hypothetical protein